MERAAYKVLADRMFRQRYKDGLRKRHGGPYYHHPDTFHAPATSPHNGWIPTPIPPTLPPAPTPVSTVATTTAATTTTATPVKTVQPAVVNGKEDDDDDDDDDDLQSAMRHKISHLIMIALYCVVALISILFALGLYFLLRNACSDCMTTCRQCTLAKVSFENGLKRSDPEQLARCTLQRETQGRGTGVDTSSAPPTTTLSTTASTSTTTAPPSTRKKAKKVGRKRYDPLCSVHCDSASVTTYITQSESDDAADPEENGRGGRGDGDGDP